ncbi:hypothetical protein COB80_01100 [Candidatus Kaiserbacteria bacterium]|nr:MAG: hypothetical protein COB80_01100 [Candidatus Kaiserbacteria bacterium]
MQIILRLFESLEDMQFFEQAEFTKDAEDIKENWSVGRSVMLESEDPNMPVPCEVLRTEYIGGVFCCYIAYTSQVAAASTQH